MARILLSLAVHPQCVLRLNKATPQQASGRAHQHGTFKLVRVARKGKAPGYRLHLLISSAPSARSTDSTSSIMRLSTITRILRAVSTS
jgi:hypothetical protein